MSGIEIIYEDDDIMVVLPGARRFGEFREFLPPEVIERYGFGPEFVPDYKALVGDTSDNIPGVPGIGDKTAKKLIMDFGSLEDIIAHVEDVTPTRARNALAANTEQAIASKRLATIVRDRSASRSSRSPQTRPATTEASGRRWRRATSPSRFVNKTSRRH